jgi:hypothetical protein
VKNKVKGKKKNQEAGKNPGQHPVPGGGRYGLIIGIAHFRASYVSLRARRAWQSRFCVGGTEIASSLHSSQRLFLGFITESIIYFILNPVGFPIWRMAE